MRIERFEDFANKNGLFVKIFDQDVEDYCQSPFRFNILFWIVKR